MIRSAASAADLITASKFTVRVGITVGAEMHFHSSLFENYDPHSKITTLVGRYSKITTRNNKGFRTRANSEARP